MPDCLKSCPRRTAAIKSRPGHLRPWIALLMMLSPAPAIAATFRVTTRIFEGVQVEAAAEHLLLFDQGLVYDFPQVETRYVTVYDAAQGRVTLLDRQTQVQSALRVIDLINVTAQARAAAQTPEQQEQLGLHAKVEQSAQGDGYSLRFGNLEYHMTTQRPEDPSVAADFARFADLASRLNLVRRLGLPPFGRMTLNSHVASLSELPRETKLTMRRGEELQEFRSTHDLEVLSEITGDDQKRIEEVRGMQALYRHVEIKDFPK
jgi:hypothetical protein